MATNEMDNKKSKNEEEIVEDIAALASFGEGLLDTEEFAQRGDWKMFREVTDPCRLAAAKEP